MVPEKSRRPWEILIEERGKGKEERGKRRGERELMAIRTHKSTVAVQS